MDPPNVKKFGFQISYLTNKYKLNTLAILTKEEIMKKDKHLNDSATKHWGDLEVDPKEQYLSDIFMLAGMATTLIFLVSVTI